MQSTNRRGFIQSGLLGLAGLALSAQRAQASSRPNILFCIADDASFPHASAYGCPWVNTPAFDRVAQDGILFTRAYTPNAKCSPSRACILTGRNSWQLEEAANHIPHFPAKFATYPEVLGEHGYHTGFTGKGWAPGNPGRIDGRRRRLTGRAYSRRKTTPPTHAMSRIDYAANFRDFLNDREDGQPFCFWYGASEPHRRYAYGSGVRKGGKDVDDIERWFSMWPDNDITRNDVLDYAYEIEYFDQHLQKMLDQLEEMGELENTLVVVTSDNGMPFPRLKGQCYEQSNHMPLAVMWADAIQNPGRVVDDFVSFVDFAPTFLEAAGIDPDAMQPMAGRSLFDIFESSQAGQVNAERDFVLIGKERHDIGRPRDWGYPVRGIIHGDYLYLYNFKPQRWPAGHPFTGYLNTDGSPTKSDILRSLDDHRTDRFWKLNFGKRPQEELYHLPSDPNCVRNLAGQDVYQSISDGLHEQLFTLLREQKDPRVVGDGDIFDHYEYAGDEWRGFYEKKRDGDQRVPGWINPSDFDVIPD